MYKDKEKQREAQRDWVRQKRAAKGSTEQGSTQGVTITKADSHVGASDISAVKAIHRLIPKRGKDIKGFKDLPLDVQRTINRMSTTEGKLDEAEKAKRTAAAIKYQHLFPESYEPGACDGDFTRLLTADAGLPIVRVSKPGDDDYVPMCETTRKYIEGSAS